MVRVLFALWTILYGVAYFTGLEYHSGYWGNAYQALHPESFQGDPYMAGNRPTMLSLYYGFVRLVGDRWLDDRLTLCVYLGLVLLAIAAVDRLARLFGASRPAERLAIVSLMLVSHSFKDGQGVPVSSADFNPTTVAGPIALWLLWAGLSGARTRVILGLMALLALISVKNAWLPLGITGLLWARQRLSPRAQRAVGAGALMAAAAALSVYYLWLRPPGDAHPALFDYILQHMDNSEANPFLDTWAGNAAFLTLCGAAWLVRLPDPAMTQKLRVVAGAGLVVFALGGGYLSYAPAALKIPYLVPFDPNRALWWPIAVLLVALSAAVLRRLAAAASWRQAAPALAGLIALYLLPWHAGRAALLALTLAAGTLWRRLTARPAASWVVGLAALGLALTSSATLAWAAWRRLPALRTLAATGIMGDHPAAKWMGVSEFIRARTPPTATVLALVERDYSWRPPGLRADGSLRIRTGRGMPVGHDVAFHFDLERLRWNQRRMTQEIPALTSSWSRRDPGGVSAALAALGSPDYLVVPLAQAGWVEDQAPLGYARVADVGAFTILKRQGG